MADRFYTSFALSPGPAVIQGPEAHHLAAVRRFRAGDRVILFNGDGCEYPAEVVAVDRKSVALQVVAIENPQRELGSRLEVAAPLPKSNRSDFLIEKLTELGVTDFIPLRTKRSVVHPHGAKLDRLRRAVIEASKQCGRNVLMRIGELSDWSDYCCQAALPSARWLGHTTGVDAMPDTSRRADVAVAVGPEGGFTEAELESAWTAGWKSVSLGPRVLRVETAAIALAVFASQKA